jgi:uncharacterized protein with ParB-like and HNH nuclease domain
MEDKMELQANARTLTNILSVNKKYIVPRFQREYSWGKEQVNELWYDIVSNIRWLEDEKIFELNEYFLGALVLVGQETSSSLLIVDGQQRLTSLTILLSALCDRFKEIGEDAVATSIYNNYISGIDDDGNPFFKLINESPKPYFQRNIQHIDKLHENADSLEEKTLKSAYDEMKENLSQENLRVSLAIPHEFFEYTEVLKAVRDQVLRFLKVIYITVNDEDEAYTIFETLNARGLNLSYVDLIKNKLFKKLNGTHPDDDAKTKWNKIRKIIASRSGVGSMETFIRHWWVSKYSYVSSDNVYKAFIDKWRKDEIDANNFINELLNDAPIYVMLSSPVETDFPELEMKAVYRGLQALKLFNIVQNKPFLLSLFKARANGKLKLVDFKRAILSIERFHFLFNAICSMRPSGIEGSYSKTARILVSNNSTKKSNRLAINSLLTMLINRKPDQITFNDKFSKLRFSNKELKSKKLIQYIFNRIELHGFPYGEYTPDSLTLEHILSQDGADSDIIGKVGNLLPLPKELNEEAGNKPVQEKMVIYQKSQYRMVTEFIIDFKTLYKQDWNQETIEIRTALMADYAYSCVWKIGG